MAVVRLEDDTAGFAAPGRASVLLVAIVVTGFLLMGLVLLAPRVAADTWTQSSQADFLSGTLSNVTAPADGTLHLTSNGTVFGNAGVVVPTGPPGTADSLYARYPTVLRESDGSYKMWYSGQDGYRNRMLYATSADGIVWTKYGVIMDVLTPPYYWDSIAGQSVLKIGSTYHMWLAAGYWSGGPFTFWAQIYHATSSDGINWNISGVALPPNQAWDVGATGAPWVVQDRSGLFWLFFSGWDGSNTRVGVATSTNGTSFTPYAGNPIVSLGAPGSWESQDTNNPAAVLGSTWTLLYAGTDRATEAIGVATSSDGFNWMKSLGNPVYVPEPPPAFDSRGVDNPMPLDDPSGPRMYFAGSDGSTVQIGVFMNVTAYDSEGTYISRVFDSGSRLTTWQSIRENGTTPSSTGVTAALRSGDTATPDASWSDWQTVDSSGIPPSPLRGRYVQYRLTLSSPDRVGTPTVDDVTVTYALDEGPAATGLQPAGPGWLANATLRWTPTDPEGDPQTAFEVQLSRDPAFAVIEVTSGPTSSTANEWVPSGLPDGTWSWRVHLSDGVAWGPWATSSFRLDQSPPALSVLVPTAGSAIAVSGIPVVWTASDPYSGVDHVELQLDGGTPVQLPSTVSFYTFPPVVDGLHVVVVRAFDAVGNVVTENVPVKVDTVRPTVRFVSPVDDTTFTSSRVLLRWEANGTGTGIARYELRLDHGLPINLSADQTNYLLANVRDGDHVVELTAIDDAGNPATATLVFRVDTNVFSLSGPIGPWLDVALIVAAIGVAAFFTVRQIRRRTKGSGPPPGS